MVLKTEHACKQYTDMSMCLCDVYYAIFHTYHCLLPCLSILFLHSRLTLSCVFAQFFSCTIIYRLSLVWSLDKLHDLLPKSKTSLSSMAMRMTKATPPTISPPPADVNSWLQHIHIHADVEKEPRTEWKTIVTQNTRERVKILLQAMGHRSRT